MNTAKLLVELKARGVLIEAEGDHLKVNAPRGALTLELRSILMDRKQEILVFLLTGDAEIAWRVAAMLLQIPLIGPVPFLVARESVVPQKDYCLSCGNQLGDEDACRCQVCSRAANLALQLFMSRSHQATEQAERLN